MPETTEAIIGKDRRVVEVVVELPKEATKDKIVYNKTDRYFYMGVEVKEEN